MEEETKREEERPERPVARGPAPIPVTIVETAGPTALIQWDQDGAPRRGYVPVKEVREGAVSKRALDAAAPYGVAWAKFAKEIKLSPADIEAALHQRGFWTLADVAANRASISKWLFEQFGFNELINRASKAQK